MLKTGYQSFDELTNGLLLEGSYVALGEKRSGKSSFALSFIEQGLRAGEGCAILTASPVPNVLAQAELLGYQWNTFLESGLLAILEFQTEALEGLQEPHDLSAAVSDFQRLLSGMPFRRLIVDSPAPLFENVRPSQLKKGIETVIAGFRQLGAACVYVLDTPESQLLADSFRYAADGVFSFSQNTDARTIRMRVDRFPGLDSNLRDFEFVLEEGRGLVDRTPDQTEKGEPQTPAWRVLLIGPCSRRRQLLKEAIEPLATVIEATDSRDGLRLAYMKSPDLVIAHGGTRGSAGLELTRELREYGNNVPVLLYGSCYAKPKVQASAIAAGADVCMSLTRSSQFQDSRLIQLHCYNLLRRWSPALRDVRFAPLTSLSQVSARSSQILSKELNTFLASIERQAEHNGKLGLSFAIVTMQLPQQAGSTEDLHAAVTFSAGKFIRGFEGERGVALLLAEPDAASEFLSRFEQRWRDRRSIAIELHSYSGGDSSAVRAMELVLRQVGPLVMQTAAKAASPQVSRNAFAFAPVSAS